MKDLLWIVAFAAIFGALVAIGAAALGVESLLWLVVIFLVVTVVGGFVVALFTLGNQNSVANGGYDDEANSPTFVSAHYWWDNRGVGGHS